MSVTVGDIGPRLANALDGYCQGRLEISEAAFIKRQRELINSMRRFAGHSQYKLLRQFYDSYTDGYWVANDLYKEWQ